MAPLRIALFGLGDAGRLHARALTATTAAEDGVVWTAIAGRDQAGVDRFRARAAVPSTVAGFASLDALLAADVADAVIIATPDGVHAEHARACLAAGRHVLVEKPLALTTDDAAAVIAAATAAGRTLAVGYHLRHHVGHQRLRAERALRCGSIHHIAVRWAWPDPATDGWRARGVGARFWSLAALGTHALDLVTWLAGTPIARVAAVTEPAGEIDRAAVVALGLASGATASVSCAVTHRATSRVIVTGDRGELEAIGTLGAHGGGELWFRPVEPRGQVEALAFTPADPYRAQLVAFAAQIAAGARLDPDALLSNVRLLDRISTATTL